MCDGDEWIWSAITLGLVDGLHSIIINIGYMLHTYFSIALAAYTGLLRSHLQPWWLRIHTRSKVHDYGAVFEGDSHEKQGLFWMNSEEWTSLSHHREDWHVFCNNEYHLTYKLNYDEGCTALPADVFSFTKMIIFSTTI